MGLRGTWPSCTPPSWSTPSRPTTAPFSAAFSYSVLLTNLVLLHLHPGSTIFLLIISHPHPSPRLFFFLSSILCCSFQIEIKSNPTLALFRPLKPIKIKSIQRQTQSAAIRKKTKTPEPRNIKSPLRRVSSPKQHTQKIHSCPSSPIICFQSSPAPDRPRPSQTRSNLTPNLRQPARPRQAIASILHTSIP